MPRWLIQYPAGQGREDYRIDDDLTLTFHGDWAIFTDARGPTYAIPAGLGLTIERVDEEQESAHKEPAPQKERTLWPAKDEAEDAAGGTRPN